MPQASSESRTLLLILALVGALSCGCLCVPLGLLGLGLGLPAVAQVQKAADRVAQKNRPPLAASGAPAMPPAPSIPRPPFDAAPPHFPPPMRKAPAFPPGSESRPPGFAPRQPENSPAELAVTGLAALSDQQRKSAYFAASVARSGVEGIQEQRERLAQQGINTAALDGMIQTLQARQETTFDRLARQYKISREELDQILAEGDQQGWRGPTRQKKPGS